MWPQNTKQIQVVVFRFSFIRLYRPTDVLLWCNSVNFFNCLLRSSNRFNSAGHSSYSWLRLLKDLEEVKAAVTGSLSSMFDYRGRHGTVLCTRGRPTAAQYVSEADGVSRQCMWRVKTSALLHGRDWLMCGDCKLSGTAECWPDWPAAAAVTRISRPYFNIARNSGTTGFNIIRKFQCFILFK